MLKAYRAQRQSGIDWVLLFSYIALVVIGLLMIYTTTYDDQSTTSMWSIRSVFGKQALWVVVSFIALTFLTVLDWHIWNTLSWPLYALGILLLILVLIFGEEIKGAKSWIYIGSWSLQPSEFVKASTCLLAASLLSSVQTKLTEIRSQLIMLGLIALPAFLIVLQPDPGSAITFASLLIVYFRFGMPTIYYGALFSIFIVLVFSLTQGFYVVAGGLFLFGFLITYNWSDKTLTQILFIVSLLFINVLGYQLDYKIYTLALNAIIFIYYLFYVSKDRFYNSKPSFVVGLLLLCLISFGSSFVFNNVLKPHQQDRINVWLQPEKSDPQGSRYNLIYSKLAIGSGGLTGKGYLNGTLTKLDYVPEQTSDFIFSGVGEEQGFIGSVSVVILFLIMSLRLVFIGERSKYSFVKAYCYSVAGFIFLHFFINIGMTMGVSPIIGIPLPFISKGGSSLLAFSIMIGIGLNMSKE